MSTLDSRNRSRNHMQSFLRALEERIHAQLSGLSPTSTEWISFALPVPGVVRSAIAIPLQSLATTITQGSGPTNRRSASGEKNVSRAVRRLIAGEV